MREVYVPPGGPPQNPIDRAILPAVGEDGVRKLLHLHYANLEQSSIRGMFPEDMELSADKSADFFIQAMGGPPLYVQKYGPPRMRARHMPFPINEKARQIWLDCMWKAMDDLPFPAEHRPAFEEFLTGFSAWMVNTR